ncbi:hypothetical protein AOT83_00420 [Mycobacteroides sp. H001]|nr:hypothetical protein AOT83_00420 [Mycobacteroides sp. H001]OHU12939.1 hypothetical protein BKG75_18200 [Mycobacteroides chelonae]OHU68244.1 hypothetical protein BKG87_16410 [Mycobacteroides chelonae]OLT78734.1 hypothetical protein BKG57_12650 [Mycobacteroides chelonae]
MTIRTLLAAHPSAATAGDDADVDGGDTDAADEADVSLDDCCDEHPAATTTTPNNAPNTGLQLLMENLFH